MTIEELEEKLNSELLSRDIKIRELENKLDQQNRLNVVPFSAVQKIDKAYINRIAGFVAVDNITPTKTGGTAVIADGNHTITIPDGGGSATIVTKGGIITSIT